MSDTERKQAEKQAKIYLTVLAGLLVVAVMVTMFTLYRQDQQSAEEDGPETTVEQQTAEEEMQQLQDNRPVQHNFADPNSQIQKDSMPDETSKTVKEIQESTPPLEDEKTQEPQTVQPEDIEEGNLQEDIAAEPQNMTAAFDPNEDLMVWPVSGVVLMDYSADALIYDETLDLYRTNESISIGAAEAEEVLAAADGIVTDIGKSDALGNYVVLDNGSGYETTYGQLSEDLAVDVGEYVAQGEVLGCIDAPSWYSSALGTHLNFTVRVNGETINPLEFLENVLEDE
ncbi:MAG: M23 family metallopeptidase [Firmicutes bacterium]|nr:M23 family metallopeptidase [Bacillota bacterium]